MALTPYLVLAALFVAPAVATTYEHTNPPLWIHNIDAREDGLRFNIYPFNPDFGGTTFLARLRVTLHPEGTGTPLVVADEQISVEIPQQTSAAWRDTPVVTKEIPIAPAQGYYRISFELFPSATTSEPRFHETGATLHVGPVPTLADGIGKFSAAGVSEFDLTGDGLADVWLRDPGTGEGLTSSIVVAADTYRTKHGRHWVQSLNLGSEGTPPMRAALNATSYFDMMDADSWDQIRMSENTAGMKSVDANGDLIIDLPAAPEGGYIGLDLFRYIPDPPPSDIATWGWQVGQSVHVNLTSWDLDRDGNNDISLYESTATHEEAARSQPTSERSALPARLRVVGVINDTADGREVTFAVARLDGGHSGAWMQLRTPLDVIRRALSTNATDPNAPLIYDLSLSPSEGFIEASENETWVWFGHFSTQYLRVLLPLAPPNQQEIPGDATPLDVCADFCPSETAIPPWRSPVTKNGDDTALVPGPSIVFPIAAALVVVALKRRHSR